ncbi:MAG: cobalamin-binding protein, partial [Sphingomonas sp.]
MSALIECEIIPRLMAAHASAAMPSAEIGTDGPIDSVEVGIFA